MNEAPKTGNEIDIRNIKEPYINNFDKIKIKHDGNCLQIAIFNTLNINENFHTELREEISNNIKNYNYNKDILDTLNYQNSEQLSKDTNKIDIF